MLTIDLQAIQLQRARYVWSLLKGRQRRIDCVALLSKVKIKKIKTHRYEQHTCSTIKQEPTSKIWTLALTARFRATAWRASSASTSALGGEHWRQGHLRHTDGQWISTSIHRKRVSEMNAIPQLCAYHIMYVVFCMFYCRVGIASASHRAACTLKTQDNSTRPFRDENQQQLQKREPKNKTKPGLGLGVLHILNT